MQVLAHKVTVKVGLSHDRNNDLITIKCMLFLGFITITISLSSTINQQKKEREKRCHLNNGKRR
jgi:hypothetical protein